MAVNPSDTFRYFRTCHRHTDTRLGKWPKILLLSAACYNRLEVAL